MPRGVGAFQESAALTFAGSNSDRVQVTAQAAINDLTAYTILMWLYPTSLANQTTLASKGAAGSHTGWRIMETGVAGDILVTLGRATSDYTLTTSSVPLATLAKWYLFALTIDQSGPTGNIYVGDQVTPASKPTQTPVNGSGAFGVDNAIDLRWGNNAAATASFPGRQAVYAYFGRVLSLPEIIAWQFSALDDPWPAVMGGCRGLWYPGNEGAAKVIDYSGYNNIGTVTGATLSRGVQLLARDAMGQRRIA